MDINSINEHSPWWARAFAIFLGIMLFFTVANLFYIEIFGINGINHYSFGNEPINPGEYPENGTSEEQRKYNFSLSEWEDYEAYQEMMQELEDSSLTEITQVFAVLSLLVGIPAIAMFWTQMKKCFNSVSHMVQLVRLARFGRLTFPLTLLQVSWRVFEVQIIHGWQNSVFTSELWNNIHCLNCLA